jgi:hypothetical protein
MYSVRFDFVTVRNTVFCDVMLHKRYKCFTGVYYPQFDPEDTVTGISAVLALS